MIAPVKFLGIQEGFQDAYPPMALYNTTAPFARHPRGTTISRRTIQLSGFEPPGEEIQREEEAWAASGHATCSQ